MPENAFPESFDLGDPDIQFDDLAKSHGRRRRPGDDAARRSARRSTPALADDGPFLIDLVVNNDVPDDVARAKHLKAGQS